MEFEDLPEEVQFIAAAALSALIKTSIHKKEQPEDLGHFVKSTFVTLYSSD